MLWCNEPANAQPNQPISENSGSILWTFLLLNPVLYIHYIHQCACVSSQRVGVVQILPLAVPTAPSFEPTPTTAQSAAATTTIPTTGTDCGRRWIGSMQRKDSSTSVRGEQVIFRGISNPGVRQCLGFCPADFWYSFAYESAEQQPKHCLTPGFLIPLVMLKFLINLFQ